MLDAVRPVLMASLQPVIADGPATGAMARALRVSAFFDALDRDRPDPWINPPVANPIGHARREFTSVQALEIFSASTSLDKKPTGTFLQTGGF
jgi:hypothetical protein